jgi:omega-hydroxy-beta-dihydromenaquinone-9 sulfotransferase
LPPGQPPGQAGLVAGPFFVAGTGRCGSSQLLRVLGEHPEVHSLEWESRFVVDPGGFEDLTRALTVAYTPYHADDALRRLAWLLNERLTGQTSEAFRGWGLAGEIGEDHYRAAADRLWERLAWYEFDEAVPPLSYRYGRWQYAPGEERAHRRVVARYFPDRAELIAVLREFTSGLFDAAARQAGKRTWCEKTPFSLLSIPFLLELFPEATVVVIMRHPYQVAASHLAQSWAPSTLDGVLNWLDPVYRRWLAQRVALLDDPRYLEVKAESLAAHWPASRRELFQRLGLPDADTPSTFTASRLDHRDGQLDAAQRRQVITRLQWAADELGYQATR